MRLNISYYWNILSKIWNKFWVYGKLHRFGVARTPHCRYLSIGPVNYLRRGFRCDWYKRQFTVSCFHAFWNKKCWFPVIKKNMLFPQSIFSIHPTTEERRINLYSLPFLLLRWYECGHLVVSSLIIGWSSMGWLRKLVTI